MLIKKNISPLEVADINTAGRYVKVMNCENAMRLRATNGVNVIIDTEVRAGFEIKTSEAFTLVQLTSEFEQKVDLWVSKHELKYDALSTKASRSSSFLALHYGESQQITPFDSSQYRAQVLSETACWLGGEGVTNLNGIYLPANAKYVHDSAAPLHAYITDKKTYKAVIEKPDLINAPRLEDLGGISSHVSGSRFLHKSLNWQQDTGLIDMETLQFTALDKYVKVVFVYGEKMYCIRADTGRKLYIDEISGSTYARKVDITLDEDISIRCGVFDGLHLYFSGVTGNGDEASKIYSYNMLTGELLKTDFTVGNSADGVSSMYIDSVTGEHWALSGKYIYRGDFMTSMLLFKNAGAAVSVYSGPIFLENEIVFERSHGPYASAIAFNRSDAEQVETNGTVYAMYRLDKYSWVYVSGEGLGVTNDNFTGKEILYTFEELGAARAEFSSFFMFGDGLYCLLKDADTGKRMFVKFPAVVDKAEPKALFRVFKESF